MTAKEIIEELKKYPPDTEVYMAQRLTEFEFGLINSVRSDEVYPDDEGEPPIFAITLHEE